MSLVLIVLKNDTIHKQTLIKHEHVPMQEPFLTFLQFVTLILIKTESQSV